MEAYSAKYTDEHGEFETTIRNDWINLRMNVRGIEFCGRDFDSFEISDSFLKEKSNSFFLTKFNDLCDCEISCEIPIEILADQQNCEAILLIDLKLGKETENGGLDKEDLLLTLKFNELEFRSKGVSGWFEDELIDVQKQLPENHKLKNCFGCDLSDYSIYGHGLFGNMLCFRNVKKEYKKVSNKQEYMEIMEKSIEQVQEIYLCPEFEIRKPGRGYRG